MTSPPLSVMPGVYQGAIGRGIDPKHVDLMFEVLGVSDVQSVGGANANGVLDSRAAIVRVDQIEQRRGGTVLFSPGRYRVMSNLTVVSPVQFAPGAVLIPDAGVTITLNQLAPPPARFQVFDISKGGTVMLAPHSNELTRPEWWGGLGDLTLVPDDAPGMLAAIAAAELNGYVQLSDATYTCGSGLAPRNASIRGLTGPGTQGSTSILARNFSGDFITIDGSATLSDMIIDDESIGAARTGAAWRYLYHIDGGGEHRPGFCRNSNVRVTSSDPAGAWERVLDIDGSQDVSPFGARDIVFDGCWFFGGRTPQDTIRIRKGVHVYFTNSPHVPAPTNIVQGVTIDVNSVAVFFDEFDMIGTLSSHGSNVTYMGGTLGDAAAAIALTIQADAVQNQVVTTVSQGTCVNLSPTSLVMVAGSVGGLIFAPPGNGLRIVDSTGGTLGLSADATEVRVESLNAVKLRGKANGVGGWIVNPDGTMQVETAFFPPNLTPAVQNTAGIYGGAGVPSNALGANGNYFYRSDTPGTALQRVYVKSAGAWVGIV